MTPRGSKRTWEELLLLDQATPHTSRHLGLEYQGEIVRTETWSPEWSEPLDGIRHYRIVLLENRPTNGPVVPDDPRIALCLPARQSSRKLAKLHRELEATNQAVYLTRRSPDAATVAHSLRDRRLGLQEQIVEEQCLRYAGGSVLVGGSANADPASIFADDDIGRSLDRLAGWILDHAYPTLPIDSSHLPGPISGDDLGGFFAALFDQTGASSTVLDRLGPPLGISSEPVGGVRRLSDCAVFPLIREKLASLPVPASAAVLHRYLDHEVGLTSPLAALYILLFGHNERPELELRLNSQGRIELADGRPFLATRITPDLIPMLRWDEQLADQLATIGPMTAPRWSDARQHLAALCPEFGDPDGGDGHGASEQRLSAALAAMHRDIEGASALLLQIERAELPNGAPGPEESHPAIEALTGPLSRLSLVSGKRYDEVYSSIRRVYTEMSLFDGDLAILGDLTRWAGHSEEILRAQKYLAGATIPADRLPGLAVDWEALWSQVSPVTVARTRGRGWEGLARDVAAFKAAYGLAYREHHAAFFDALPHYQIGLESANRKLAALELFNTLPELGAAVGADLAGLLPEMGLGLELCNRESENLDLAAAPYCNQCNLSLEHNLPIAQLARTAPVIDAALSQKTRALSVQLVDKVIDGRYDPRMDEFLKIVQASELSALANTLDTELLSFIRQVLD